METHFILTLNPKTTVMHQVMENKRIEDYWRNDNLPTCFVDAVQRLLDGLKRGNITDIFFPEVKGFLKN